MTQHFQHALVAVGAIVTFAYGQLLPHLFAGRMPQVPGENVVAMLGDARQVSFALLEKADDYFHGGVRHAECDHNLSSASQKESEHHSPQRADTRMHTATITTTITTNMMRRLRRSIPGGGSIAACMCRTSPHRRRRRTRTGALALGRMPYIAAQHSGL